MAEVLPYEQQKRVTDAVLAIKDVADPNHRRMYVEAVGGLLGTVIPFSADSDTRHEVWRIVGLCAMHRGGLHCLAYVLRDFIGPSEPVVRLMDTVGKVEDQWLLETREHARLKQLLDRRPVPKVYAAVAANATIMTEPFGSTRGLRVEDYLDRLEAAGPPRPDHPLLRWVDGVAHRVDSGLSVEIHEWINLLGARFSFQDAELRALCSRNEPLVKVGVSILAADPPHASDASDARSVPVEVDLRSARTDNDHLGRGGNAEPASFIVATVTDIAPGVEVITTADQAIRAIETGDRPPPSGQTRSIWGGVPPRNPHFTGRRELLKQLHDTLTKQSRAAVLPQTLHGLGGVGKTQVAVEYVYQHADDYDWVWWIAAEEPAAIRASLAELGDRLSLSPSVDISQTAAAVLDALGTASQRWLIVFDNADQPHDLDALTPSAGGHVIITSRNEAWGDVGDAVEVDVFHRRESVDLLTARGLQIGLEDADLLADKLGDLPLALEQAAIWQASTGMPVSEYVDLFDEHARELLSEGKPANYRQTAAVSVSLAFDRLQRESPPAARLLELFIYLGSDPVSVSLLRSSGAVGITDTLGTTLHDSILFGRAIRTLRRFGLAKVDPNGRRIWVHRLVQAILKDSLEPEQRDVARRNVHQILAAANPTEPDDHRTWPRHSDIRPHVMPADMIHSEHEPALLVVLDQIRYLYAIGDLEGSLLLGEKTVTTWNQTFPEAHGLTLLATRHLANTLRALGEYERAYDLDESVLRRFTASAAYGENHEHTLLTRNSFGADLRIRGLFQEALANDEENLHRHLDVFIEEDDPNVLRTKGNLAVDYRLIGDFQAAQRLDDEIVVSRRSVGENTPALLFSISNLARDRYGIGEYREALELQLETLPLQREQLGPYHPHALLAARTVAMARRKLGEYDLAVKLGRDLYRDYNAKFGPDHEHTLAATMTFANSLRVIEQLGEARSIADDACKRYQRRFGAHHPFTLAAQTNFAIIRRAVGEQDDARELDEMTFKAFTEILGPDHPYTLCAANSLANDLWAAQERVESLELSEDTYRRSIAVRGLRHPYTLSCAVNVALGRRSLEVPTFRELLDSTLALTVEVRGAKHPETLDAGRGRRAECDIEPPPS